MCKALFTAHKLYWTDQNMSTQLLQMLAGHARIISTYFILIGYRHSELGRRSSRTAVRAMQTFPLVCISLERDFS